MRLTAIMFATAIAVASSTALAGDNFEILKSSDEAKLTNQRMETVNGTGATPLSMLEMRNIRGAATLTISPDALRSDRVVAVPGILFDALVETGKFPESDGSVIISDPGVGIRVAG